jgi:hypothetical protein
MSFGPTNNNVYWRGGGYYNYRRLQKKKRQRQLEDQARREAQARRIRSLRQERQHNQLEILPGEEFVLGHARLVKRQYQQPWSTLTFQFWSQDDGLGKLPRSMPVEVKVLGDVLFDLVNEEDLVALTGKWRDGRFRTHQLRNLATGAVVTVPPFFA